MDNNINGYVECCKLFSVLIRNFMYLNLLSAECCSRGQLRESVKVASTTTSPYLVKSCAVSHQMETQPRETLDSDVRNQHLVVFLV